MRCWDSGRGFEKMCRKKGFRTGVQPQMRPVLISTTLRRIRVGERGWGKAGILREEKGPCVQPGFVRGVEVLDQEGESHSGYHAVAARRLVSSLVERARTVAYPIPLINTRNSPSLSLADRFS